MSLTLLFALGIASNAAPDASVSVSDASSNAYRGRSVRVADNSEQVVCKMRKKTGTRFLSRLCMKRADWELGSERAKREARELIDTPKGVVTFGR